MLGPGSILSSFKPSLLAKIGGVLGTNQKHTVADNCRPKIEWENQVVELLRLMYKLGGGGAVVMPKCQTIKQQLVTRENNELGHVLWEIVRQNEI